MYELLSPETREKYLIIRAKNLALHTNERPLVTFPARAQGIICEKWGVKKWPAGHKKLKRNLLILGTGRCGTHHTSKLLKSIGCDVGHEIVGSVGTCTHFFMVDSDWNPKYVFTGNVGQAHVGQRLSDYDFKNVVHLVRNPLITISSLTEWFPPLELEFFEDNKIIPMEDRKKRKRDYRGMVMWYYVNKYIDDHFPKAPLFRLEDGEKWWPDLLKMAGVPLVPRPPIPPSNKSSFRRKSHELTTEEIFTIDPDLASKIFALAKKYGYNLF